MRKVITAFIATLLFGTYLVHADVYVRYRKYSKPAIITKEEFESKIPDSKVESKHGTLGNQETDYELIILPDKQYVHYIDISEEEFWKGLEFQIQSGQGS